LYCIVKTTTNNENINSRAEYGIFEITQELVNWIIGLQAAVKLVKNTFEAPQALTVHDSTPVFFAPYSLFEEESGIIELLETQVDEGYIFVDDLPVSKEKLENCITRIDAPVLKIYGAWPDSIRWFGFIKHCGVTFDTDRIRIEDLKNALMLDENLKEFQNKKEMTCSE
jgi:hypothetical protein